ncbi:MAG: NADH-quinone oxidoreductase subunit NuoK [Desulfobacteraceae bacterium]|jgi:NADH-quinone oxidoreductase subunit K|nr:MAG: NADH-quinone oxidoreductase subunit NuoK [Desulfobacteraceae bacterium]
MIALTQYLTVSSILLVLGLAIIISKRNAIAILIGVEFVLNAANLNLVAFSRHGIGGLDGQTAALFIIVIAAAEAAVALAIFLNFYHVIASIDIDRGDRLKG